MENSKTLAVHVTDRTATGQLQAIAATAPSHIIEALMNQKKTATTKRIHLLR